MANLIGDIYEEIRRILQGLKIKEAKEYFDSDNIPDNLADNSFIIAPFEFGAGDSITDSTHTVIVGLMASIAINLSFQLPANNKAEKMKSVLLVIQNIIKGVLGIITGEDEKNFFTFIDAPFRIDGSKLIYTINFNLSYRIKNI